MGDVINGKFPSPAEPDEQQLEIYAVADNVTHRELDARLEAVEARSTARFDKIDLTLSMLVAEIKDTRRESAEQAKAVKSNIWLGVATAISVTLAVLAYGVQSKDSMRDTLMAAKDLAATATEIQPLPKAAVPDQSSKQLEQSGRKGG